METAETKFLAALREIAPNGGVLIALSGGADSICLLDLFLCAKARGDFPFPVAAAHLNHSLRGKESDRDEAFCRAFCENRGIPLVCETADVAAFAKQEDLGTEEAARKMRYAFLERARQSLQGIAYIATAHNKDDFCETMLLNLVRGSGLSGLCSIPRRRDAIIRPLLDVSRTEILAYNSERQLSFVTDSTNADPVYSRNRVRHCVLPELSKISAGYADTMTRTAALLRRDAEYLDGEARKLYTECVQSGILYTKSAQNFHLSMLSRIVKMLYNEHGFSNLAQTHIDAICTQIRLGKENFTLSLPESYALCERGKLRFVRELPTAAEFCLPIRIGETVTLPFGMSLTLSDAPTADAVPLRRDALCGELTVRSRHAGDTITVFGKTHKIKRMIADKKYTEAQKAKLFFLCADDTILYTNLPATADRAFCRAGDGPCIFITIKETL